MPGPTLTSDIGTWIPDVVSTTVYDTMFDSDLTLSGDAVPYGDVEGTPGDTFTIPTVNPTSPADNLAENVEAVDDKLTSGGVTITIKEAVKSISWTDRVKVQSSVDVNRIAGQRVGNAMNDRVELDLGATLLTLRNTAGDTSGALTIAAIRAMKAQIPAKLRRKGLTLYAESDILDALLDDPLVQNAATFGSDEAIRNGEFSRPLAGVSLKAVDDGTFGNITVGLDTGPAAVLMVKGMLYRGFQRRPQTEPERNARGRVTRIVGTVFHGEGVLDSRGVVARAIV